MDGCGRLDMGMGKGFGVLVFRPGSGTSLGKRVWVFWVWVFMVWTFSASLSGYGTKNITYMCPPPLVRTRGSTGVSLLPFGSKTKY